jgi:hypothetical protein
MRQEAKICNEKDLLIQMGNTFEIKEKPSH